MHMAQGGKSLRENIHKLYFTLAPEAAAGTGAGDSSSFVIATVNSDFFSCNPPPPVLSLPDKPPPKRSDPLLPLSSETFLKYLPA